MEFDQILTKLNFQQRDKLAQAALYFPRIAPGHGSLRDGQCNAVGCRGENHIQERTEKAYYAIYGK